MSRLSAWALVAEMIAALTQPAVADEFPVTCKLPAAQLDDMAGADGPHATMRGKITPEADRSWRQTDPTQYVPVANTRVTVAANCDTGTIELKTSGRGKPIVWKTKLPVQSAGCEDNTAVLQENFARLCPKKSEKFH